MLGKGGWYIDADHELPTAPPPKELVLAYKKALATWKKQDADAAALSAKVAKMAAKKGLYFNSEEAITTAEDKPWPLERVEVAKTELDRLVKEYRETGSVEALRKAQEIGCKVIYYFSGWSGGYYPPSEEDFLRDGPPIPDGLKVVRK